jgi:hypothetical protein
MHRHVGSTLALLILAAPRGAVAQTSLAGRWRTAFDVGIRVVDGVESSEGKGHARITLEVKGDSVVGQWLNIDSPGGAPRTPRPLRGVVTDSGARLETVEPREVVLRTPDGEQHFQTTMTYTFRLRGDSLVGTEQWIAVDHSSRGPLRPFVATRERP